MLLSPEAAAVNFLAATGKDRPRAYAAALAAHATEKVDRGAVFHLGVLASLEPRRALEDRTIDLALADFMATARKSFEADGSTDIGDCGGVMLAYRGNTRFAKALVNRKVGHKMDGKVYVAVPLPQTVRTQHRKVQEDAYRAFAIVAEAAGFVAAVHYSYAD